MRRYETRRAAADCSKGKHLWLVSTIECANEGSSAQEQFYRVYGHCELCAHPGQSDLKSRTELPLNENLFICLNPVRLPKAQ